MSTPDTSAPGFNERELAKLSRLFARSTHEMSVRRSARQQRTAALAEAEARRPGEIHRVDGRRHPPASGYLGLRDDKKAGEVDARGRTPGSRRPPTGESRLERPRPDPRGSNRNISVGDQLRFLEDNRRDGRLDAA